MEKMGIPMQDMLNESVGYARSCLAEGTVASYIPELAKADASALGVCLVLRDGTKFHAGCSADRFTIQSISKVITLIYALETCGFNEVFSKVGMEPTGDAFNSFMKLETVSGKPFNPMINAGAIVTTSCVTHNRAFEEMKALTRRLCMDDSITLDRAVYQSEKKSGARNRSLAHLLVSKELLHSAIVEKCLDLYFRMCSLSVSAENLAVMGAVLSAGGVNPTTGERLMEDWIARIAKTLMFTCGMYDGSGEFAIRVGLPSKSGVGGGILSCAPDGSGIGVYGPALDPKGNSVGGMRVLEYIAHTMGYHLFAGSAAGGMEQRMDV